MNAKSSLTTVIFCAAIACGGTVETIGNSAAGSGGATATSSSASVSGSAAQTSSATSSTGTGGAECDQQGQCSYCKSCAIKTVCASQAMACLSNPLCSALANCVDACGGGAACVAGCKQQYAGGVVLYDPLEKCELSTCPMTCK